jgi:hypothetical protein
MRSRLGWVLRMLASLATTLMVGQAHAQHAHCSYGWQDSSCVTPVYRADQQPPTCSTDPGWTTVTAAKWIGSRFTQPVCNYQVPPTCQSGQTQISDPVWDGLSWSAPGCIPPTAPPQNPAQVCTNAVMGGTVLTGGNGFSTRQQPSSSFAQTVNFVAVPYTSAGYAFVWQFPTYSISDAFTLFDIQTAAYLLALPNSSWAGNTWYAASYTGPTYGGENAGTFYNGYMAWCSIDPSGNFAGVALTATFPKTINNN